MLRYVLFLMTLVLTVPMIRDCCLPVSHPLPCHETKHTDDVTCSSALQAVTEGKTSVADRPSIECSSLITVVTDSGMLPQIKSLADGTTAARILATDIYLRTGALLI